MIFVRLLAVVSKSVAHTGDVAGDHLLQVLQEAMHLVLHVLKNQFSNELCRIQSKESSFRFFIRYSVGFMLGF